MSVTGLRPGRAALLEVRKRIAIAGKGFTYLRMKRQRLLIELMRIIPEVKRLRQDLGKHYRQAQYSAAIAAMMEGNTGIMLAAYSVEENPEIIAGSRYIMGVKLPVYTSRNVIRNLDERGYGILGTGSVIDDLADEYETMVMTIIQCAEAERALQEILLELLRLRRRVNALEFRIIPGLVATRDSIRLRMDEIEREEFARLFMHKKIHGDRKEE
jgi:V/A-type H+-transporting ATPase subunit D